MHIGGNRARALDVDRVAVGLGARDIFGGDVAHRAGLILDNDGTADHGPQLLGIEAYENIGAAAGWISADKMQILRRIGLRARSRWRVREQRGANKDKIAMRHGAPPWRYC